MTRKANSRCVMASENLDHDVQAAQTGFSGNHGVAHAASWLDPHLGLARIDVYSLKIVAQGDGGTASSAALRVCAGAARDGGRGGRLSLSRRRLELDQRRKECGRNQTAEAMYWCLAQR